MINNSFSKGTYSFSIQFSPYHFDDPAYHFAIMTLLTEDKMKRKEIETELTEVVS